MGKLGTTGVQNYSNTTTGQAQDIHALHGLGGANIYTTFASSSPYPPGPSFPIAFTYTATSPVTLVDNPFTTNSTGEVLLSNLGPTFLSSSMLPGYDVSTATSQISNNLAAYLPPNTNYDRGMAFSPNGLSVYFIVTQGSGAYSVAKLNLSTPFDLATVTGYQQAAQPLAQQCDGLTIAANGTKAFLMGGGWVYQYDLSSPYNGLSIQGAPTKSFNIAGTFGLYNYPTQIAFTSDGLIGVVFESGPGYNGVITQFRLTNNFELDTIVSSSAISQPLSVGIIYVASCCALISTDNNTLLVGGYGSGFTPYKYSFSITEV
jgi:hypothetical protein